jgi:kynurenine formamidase
MTFETYKAIDLTQTLCPSTPTWNGSCGFCLEIKKDYDKLFRVQQIKMHAGLGTHIDAPSHRFENTNSISDMPIEQFLTYAHVIDVSHKASCDYEISIQDLQTYESSFGPISPNSLVIGYTGWERHWQDPAAYRNSDPQGQMHFPAFSKDAAEWLLRKDIAGIAIDTLSPDCLDTTYPVHRTLLGHGKYIIENIARAHLLPPRGAFIFALPMKMQGATEAPARIIALVPR